MRARYLAPVCLAVLSVVGCSSSGDRPAVTDPLVVVQRAGLSSAPSRAVVTLPHRSDGATRVAPRTSPDAWVEISPRSVRSVAALPAGPTRVFPRAALDTDVVWMTTAHGAEEARVLSTPRAPHTARYRLRIGPAIERLRLREGRVEAIDRSGAVAVASDPAFAVDVRGARRAVAVSLELDAGGAWMTASLDAEGLEYPIVVDPAWTTVPSMAVARRDAGAATLSSGKVLVVAGASGTGPSDSLSSGELYDPVANTWSAVAAAPLGGLLRNLVPIGTDRALAVRGFERWRYDATTNAWSAAGSPAVSLGRGQETVTRLNDGRVLVAGGDGTSTAELYDPGANTWSATGSLAGQRFGHAAAVLADGRVLVAGGVREGAVLGDVEVFDPAAGAWSAGGSLLAARYGATATRLPSGKVLIVGGKVGVNMTASVELFDPATKTATKTGSLAEPRTEHFAALLGDGRVLVVGGLYSSTNTEVWDPASGTWSSGGTLAQARAFFSGAALGGSRVLVAGGVGPLSSAELWAPQAGGAACAANGECASGVCADEVCCDRACGGSCESCKLASAVGTCTAITGAPVHAGCGAYAKCATGSCATTCAVDGDCSTGHFCDGGKCVAGRARAASCTRDRECASGFCTDGACCESRCDGQCEACDVGLDKGSCVPVNGAPHGARPACTGTGAGTECGVRCNGANRTACVLAGSTVTCSKNACTGGLETRVGVCNGAGACSESPRACGAYACGELACNTLCKTKADCAAGHYCDAGTCAPVEALGRECAAADTCASGFCTDGVCCGVAACPAGSTCSAKSHEGTCAKIDGQRCDSAAECGSGHCVDSVCCESACGDQCAACDVPGSFGKCKAVKGAPHGARTPCAKDASNACASRACDGVQAASCDGLVGFDVTCREAKCEAGTLTEKAACDGSGTCPSAITASCGGFACEPGAAACKVRCGRDEDCIATHVCREGACAPRTAVCDPDGLAVIELSGETRACAPYVCRGGDCLKTCSTTNECVAGYTCDPGSRTCVPSAAPVEDSGGGCQVSGGRRAGVTLPLSLVALVAALIGRRRRWSVLGALALLGCGGSRANREA
ncbi:MAG: hypothetical protein HYV09_21285, partial [Deltaproteobacteria bacterium]|nr:hypothetical protein [Deltaproteobacteria bacterium]